MKKLIPAFLVLVSLNSCFKDDTEFLYRISGIEETLNFDYESNGENHVYTQAISSSLLWDQQGRLIHSESISNDCLLYTLFPFFNTSKTDFTYDNDLCSYQTYFWSDIESEGTLTFNENGYFTESANTYRNQPFQTIVKVEYDSNGYMRKIISDDEVRMTINVSDNKIISTAKSTGDINNPTIESRTFEYYDKKAKINPLNSGIPFLGKMTPYLVKKVNLYYDGELYATTEFNYTINDNGFVTKAFISDYSHKLNMKIFDGIREYLYVEIER